LHLEKKENLFMFKNNKGPSID